PRKRDVMREFGIDSVPALVSLEPGPPPRCSSPHGEWVPAQLSADDRDRLSDLPLSVALPVAELGDVRFCHAAPRGDEDILTSVSVEECLDPMFAGVTQRGSVCRERLTATAAPEAPRGV